MSVHGTLQAVVHETFEALDRKDFDRVLELVSADVESVDEISRGWLRGRSALEGYLQQIGEDVSNIHTSLRDMHATEIGEVTIVTLVIDQNYDLRGQPVEVTAPTTIVGRHEPGGWQIVLFHSVPLSEDG